MATRSLAIRQPSDIDTMTLGQILSESGYFSDARSAAQAIVKVLAGRELGFGPIASMSGIHIIQGKPSPSATLMAAAIKNSGRYNYRVREHTDDVCAIEFFENGESVGVSKFTAKDAKRAGTKNMQTYPRNMLFARAMSNGAKWFCPDVFGGPVYTPEELGADIDPVTGEVLDADTVPFGYEPSDNGPGAEVPAPAVNDKLPDWVCELETAKGTPYVQMTAEQLIAMAGLYKPDTAQGKGARLLLAHLVGAAERPYTPDELKAALVLTAGGTDGPAATEKQVGLVAGKLNEIWHDQDKPDDFRHSFLDFVFDKKSANDLTKDEASAIVELMLEKDDETGDWDYQPFAIDEAQRVIRQVCKNAGQLDLLPDDEGASESTEAEETFKEHIAE